MPGDQPDREQLQVLVGVAAPAGDVEVDAEGGEQVPGQPVRAPDAGPDPHGHPAAVGVVGGGGVQHGVVVVGDVQHGESGGVGRPVAGGHAGISQASKPAIATALPSSRVVSVGWVGLPRTRSSSLAFWAARTSWAHVRNEPAQ